MSNVKLSLLIKEPGADRTRLVKAPRVPFTLGDDPHADIQLFHTEKPVNVRVTRTRDSFFASNLTGTRPGNPAPALHLKHGARIKTGGVHIQVLTDPAQGEEATEQRAVRSSNLDTSIAEARGFLTRLDQLRAKLDAPPAFLRGEPVFETH